MKSASINLAVVGLCLISANAMATGDSVEVENCFQTLAGDQKYTLKQDLECGCGGPAVTVVGPARLDLKGYTVSCSACDDPDNPDTPGIVVEGDRAKVKNGRVRDCRLGIEIGEGKHHRFVNLTLSNNVRSGLRSESPSSHSHFEDIRAYDNGRRGLRIDGNHNKLIYNYAWTNGNQGIRIDGNHNRVDYNYAWANGNQGIRIEGDHNRVDYNTAISNCRDGIEIKNGDKNKLIGNIAYGNGSNPGACPDDGDAVFGKDYRPWFYAGIDITKPEEEDGDGMVESKTNRILDSKANDNLGCWIPPSTLDKIKEDNPDDELARDRAAWEECIGSIPINEDGEFDKDEAVNALRNRNLWDENAELTDKGYKCNSDNKWRRNRSGSESNAKPECPCIEGVEGEEEEETCNLAQ